MTSVGRQVATAFYVLFAFSFALGRRPWRSADATLQANASGSRSYGATNIVIGSSGGSIVSVDGGTEWGDEDLDGRSGGGRAFAWEVVEMRMLHVSFWVGPCYRSPMWRTSRLPQISSELMSVCRISNIQMGSIFFTINIRWMVPEPRFGPHWSCPDGCWSFSHVTLWCSKGK